MNEETIKAAWECFRETGDRKAFGQLVNEYAPLVHGLASRRLQSNDLAQDVTQLVFIDFAKKRKRIQPKTPLSAWLFAVTKAKSIDVLRSELQRRKREQIYAVNHDQTENTPSWEEVAEVLEPAMDQLSEREREVILLRFYEGASFQKTASALGISSEAARKRTSRAMDHLRSIFARKGILTSSAALGSVIQANGATPLTKAILSEVQVASLSVLPISTSTLLSTLLMTKTTKITIGITAGCFLGYGSYHFAAHQNQADASTPITGHSKSSLRSELFMAENDIAQRPIPKTNERIQLSENVVSIPDIYLDRAERWYREMTAFNERARFNLGDEDSNFDPKNPSWKLPATVVDSLNIHMTKRKELQQIVGKTLMIDPMVQSKERAIEQFALSEMRHSFGDQFTEAHANRLAQLTKQLGDEGDAQLREKGITSDLEKDLSKPWFEHESFIADVSNDLEGENRVAFNDFVRERRTIFTEKKVFNQSQKLSEQLQLNEEQRVAIHNALIENNGVINDDLLPLLNSEQIAAFEPLKDSARPERHLSIRIGR